MIENKFNNISLIVIVSFIESIGAYVYSAFVVAEGEVLLVAEVEELWSHYILCFHYEKKQHAKRWLIVDDEYLIIVLYNISYTNLSLVLNNLQKIKEDLHAIFQWVAHLTLRHLIGILHAGPL
jgi:hypothetical protein